MSPQPNSESAEPKASVTLRDLAEKLGVSAAAVSLALRDRGRISPSKRAEIKKTAIEMGYRPEPMARALVQFRLNKRTTSIHAALAWLNLWPEPKKMRSYREFELYWQGAFAGADAAGYRLEEFVVNQEMTLPRLQRILTTRNIRGIILPPQAVPCEWRGFDWSEFSAVRIGHSLAEPEVYVVAPDQVGNSLLAYEKMQERGYERLGLVCGAEATNVRARKWFTGGFFMAQMRESAANRIPILVLEEKNPATDLKALTRWYQRHQPDAILTEVAALPQMLATAGIRVPKDTGLATVTVLDGNVSAGINQNAERVGRAAVEILIALINRNERGPSPDYRTATVRGSWVDGDTLPVKKRRKG